MLFSRSQALSLVGDYGFDASADPESLQLDRETTAARADNIRDSEFFALLGATSMHSLDKSAYEGADIIHDLNKPIPAQFESSVDFILDGSTLDNVWDPATALRNMARLLRPGGRIVSVNQGNDHNNPYTVMSPTWVLDYFVVNRFADCRVSVTVMRPNGNFNAYSLDLDRLDRRHPAGNFACRYQTGLQFVAEKAADSTYDVSPSQEVYRSDAEWGQYEAHIALMRQTTRSDLWGSIIPRFRLDVPPGYRFEGAPLSPTVMRFAHTFAETWRQDLRRVVGALCGIARAVIGGRKAARH
jgi:SAM-dependent methyltransferase